MKDWFRSLSKRGKIVTLAVASLLSIGTVNAIAGPSPDTAQQNVTPPKSIQVDKKATAEQKPKITTKQETTTAAIAFETSTVDNPSLAQGTTQIAVNGQDGEKQTVYEVTLHDGEEVSRKEVSSSITKQPVAKVIHNGTKAPSPASSCPNGTYVNSAGNTVCSPYASSSAPAGATARCVDGTYSFSQSRRGTCSGHSGVASWL